MKTMNKVLVFLAAMLTLGGFSSAFAAESSSDVHCEELTSKNAPAQNSQSVGGGSTTTGTSTNKTANPDAPAPQKQ